MNSRKSVVWAGLACWMCIYSIGNLWGDCIPRWVMATPMPDPTTDYAVGVLDHRLVIAGGSYWEGSKGHWIHKHVASKAQAFDPVAQVWDKLPDLPEPLAGPGSGAVGNRLFVLGGYTGTHMSRSIYALTKTPHGYLWKNFGSLPVDRLFAASVTDGTKIYMLGGLEDFEPLDPTGTCCTTSTATDSFMVFDVSHPQQGWRRLPPVPGPRRFFFKAVATEKAIWIFGGRFQSKAQGPISNFSRLVFRYDLANGRWEAMKPLPQESPTADPPAPVYVRGKIILITDAKTVWQLDPTNLECTVLPDLPQAALVDEFVWIDGRIVGAGGENTLEGPRRRSDWTFIGQCGQ